MVCLHHAYGQGEELAIINYEGPPLPRSLLIAIKATSVNKPIAFRRSSSLMMFDAIDDADG